MTMTMVTCPACGKTVKAVDNVTLVHLKSDGDICLGSAKKGKGR